MAKNLKQKVWFESYNERVNSENYGMSSALGATTDDLPADVPQGSTCMDYSTKTMYFFDGVSWS